MDRFIIINIQLLSFNRYYYLSMGSDLCWQISWYRGWISLCFGCT